MSSKIENVLSDAQFTRVREPLESRGHVYPIPVNRTVSLVQDIAKIYADTKIHAVVGMAQSVKLLERRGERSTEFGAIEPDTQPDPNAEPYNELSSASQRSNTRERMSMYWKILSLPWIRTGWFLLSIERVLWLLNFY